MRVSSLKYLLSEGFKNVWKNWMMSMASIGVLVLCLLLTVPAVYLAWLPTWHTAFITGKISWEIGFSTVYPGYWIALALSFLPPLAFLQLKQKCR